MVRERFINGYKLVYKENHPNAMKSENWNGFLYEHTYVMSEHIGRPIKNNENVHHLDFDKSNNNIDNLVLLSSSAHATLHNLLDKSILLDGNIDENQIRMVDLIKEGKIDIHLDEEAFNKITKFYKNYILKRKVKFCINGECGKLLLGKNRLYCCKKCEIYCKNQTNSKTNSKPYIKRNKSSIMPKDKDLLQHLVDNYSYKEIGRMYNISDNGVKKHMRRNGIVLKQKRAKNDLSDFKDKNKLKELYDSKSKNAICREYGCDKKTLDKYLREAGLEYKSKSTKEFKRIGQYDKDGNFIREFNSVTEAEIFLGKEKGSTKISHCCLGKRKTSNKYIWKYL